MAAAASRDPAACAGRSRGAPAGVSRRRPGPVAFLPDAGARARPPLERPLPDSVVRQGDLRRGPTLGQRNPPVAGRSTRGGGGVVATTRGEREGPRWALSGAGGL